MPYRDTSNNIKAGAFLLIALLLVAAVVVTLAGAISVFKPTNTYRVRFTLQEGAADLQRGSEVRVGGRPVGQVTSVFLDDENADGVKDSVVVRMAIDHGLTIYDDALVYLEQPLFGGSSILNLPGIGGARGAEPLDEGDLLQGDLAPPGFLAGAGYGPDEAGKVRGVIDSIASLAERLEAGTQGLDGSLVENAQAFVAGIREEVDRFRARSGGWYERIDTITERGSTFATGLVETGRSIDQRVEQAREFLASLQELVDQNRPGVDRMVASAESAAANADEITARVRDETLELTNQMLRDGRDAVAEAEDAVERVDSLVAESAPDVRKAIANVRLASDQIRLTMGEVRRAPWRLLQRPSTKELEYELLYDTARSYASAVSDLRAAAESIESSIEAGPATPEQRARLRRLVEEVQDSFLTYDAAEEALLNELIQRSPGG